MYSVLYLNEVENDISMAKQWYAEHNVHFYIDESKAQVVIIGIIHNKRSNALFLNR